MSAHAPPPHHLAPPVFSRGSYAEALRIGEILRKETVGGALLLAATVVALVWANSPASESYFALRDFRIGFDSLAPGPEPGRTGPPTGCWPSSSSSPGWNSSANSSPATCASPASAVVPVAAAVGGVAVPAAALQPGQPRRRPGGPARLGHPHRHGHRLRPRRAGRHQHPPAQRAAHLPADPRRRRRPDCHRHHRRFLPQRTASRTCCCWRCSRWPLSPCWCSGGCAAGTCCSRWPSPSGRWCTPPASTPPWPASCSALPCRCAAASRNPDDRSRPGRALRAPVPAALRRCGRPRLRLLLRRRGPGRRLTGLAAAFSDSVALGIVLALVAGKAIGVFGATFLVTKTTRARARRRSRLDRRRPDLRCWQGSASPSRCSSVS